MKCYLCQNLTQGRKIHPPELLYQKLGIDQKNYNIISCPNCELWQIDPLPDEEYLTQLYQGQYFEKRSDRGYDNYQSAKVRLSIENTFAKNLADVDFFTWEKTLAEKFALEVGCSAGYFVEYLKNRNWHSQGIDVSESMINAGKKRGVESIHGNFLDIDFKENSYHLVTLWATLEHLRYPLKFIEKIAMILKSGGKCILSTCNTGFWAKIYRENWRFLNVPEHLWYFNQHNLSLMFESYSFKMTRSFTYGSGHTGKRGLAYNLRKKIADISAKKLALGDMIVIEFTKL